jgi:hypothetical protein
MAAGYLLGRFKKLRLALVVGSALASEDVRKQGATLLARGPMGLAEPMAKKAGKSISSQLLEAGKSAAVGAAGSRIGGLSDRLNERTSALQGNGASGDEPEDEADEPEDEYDEPADEAEDEPEDEPEDEDEAEDEPEDEYDEEPAEDEEPEDEEPAEDEDLADEDDEEPMPKQRSPRRRRTSSPAGR